MTRRWQWRPSPLALIIGATVIGFAIRLVVARQSLFADEVATYWVVAHHGLGQVVSIVHGDAEITPPLYFIASWLTTRIDLSPELLRAPSLIAGTAAIPLVYLLGLRSVGRPASLLATALTALSPFMIFNSAQARAYELMVVLAMISTLAMLTALDRGGARWWVVYGASSCAALYTHYSALFVLAAQLLWVLWAEPRARPAALLANVGAAIGFLPWLSGLVNDLNSPTATTILNAINSFTPHAVANAIAHWSIGYPLAYTNTTRLDDLPGPVGLFLLALALVLALAPVAVPRFRNRDETGVTGGGSRLVLVVMLALAAPVGEVITSAIGSNVLSSETLAVSWPALALSVSAALTAGGPRLRFATAGLAIAGMLVSAVLMLDTRFQRPDYKAVASTINSEASQGDVVVDGAVVSPVPLTALQTYLNPSLRVFNLGQARIRLNPFAILAFPPPTDTVVRRAAKVAARGQIFIVESNTPLVVSQFHSVAPAEIHVPSRYRQVERVTYPGILHLVLDVYADRRSSP